MFRIVVAMLLVMLVTFVYQTCKAWL